MEDSQPDQPQSSTLGETTSESTEAFRAPAQISSKKRPGSPITSDRNEKVKIEYDGNWVEKHVPDMEPKPELPMMHLRAAKAEQSIVKLSERFQLRIKENPYSGEDKIKLLGMLKSRERPPWERVRFVTAPVGAAATGKSTTLNSLFGHNLSRTSGGDTSCTNCEMRYHYVDKGQDLPFKVTIFFQCQEYIFEKLKGYLGDYFTNSKRLASITDDDEDAEPDFSILDDPTAGEQSDLQLTSRAYTALTVFNELFCAYSECHDRDSTIEFLDSATSEDDSRILGRIQKLIPAILKRLLSGSTESSISHEAGTAEQLKNSVSQYVETDMDGLASNSLRCRPLSIISKIDFGFGSQMLRTGNTLIDIPGFNDSNKLYIDVANESLGNADKIMVFSTMERCTSSESNAKLLMWAYRLRRSGNVIMVVTKCDVLSDNDEGTRFVLDERREMDKIDKELRINRNEMWSNEQSRKHAFSEGTDISRIIELERQGTDFKTRRLVLESRRFELRVQARNRTATQGLQAMYKRTTRDSSELPVFCLSNDEYVKYATGYRKDDPPRMALATTGVPALRKYITGFPSVGRFETLKHHIGNTWNTIFSTLEMASSTSKSQRKDVITEACRVTQAHATSSIDSAFKRFEDDKIEAFKSKMANNESTWRSEALKKEKTWNRIHARTIQSIIGHNGNWSTKKSGDQNWNEEITRIVRKDIDSELLPLRNKYASALGSDIAQKISQMMEEFGKQLENDPRYEITGAGAAFRASLQHRKTAVSRACVEVAKEFALSLRAIHDLAVSFGEEGYIPVLMCPVYAKSAKAIKKMKGSSIKEARLKVFRDAFNSRTGPFGKLQSEILEAIKAVQERNRDNFKQKINSIFAEIEADINLSCSSRGDDTPEGKQFQAALKELVKEGRKFRDEGPMQDLLIAEKAYT